VNRETLNYAVVARYLNADGPPADANEQWGEFNTKLAKLLQKLKKDAGAERVGQNYKGTGSQAYRRQVWARFTSGAVIDLWLDKGYLKFGGVVKNAVPGSEGRALPDHIKYENKTPEQVYTEVAKHLKEWAAPVQKA
jgi:hypothetical protein